MNKEKLKKIIKELYPYVVIVVVVVLFRTFIATPVRVDGSSMDSTLKNGDILILNKLDTEYERFDVVVVNVKFDGKTSKLVKRVIGLPGESIEYKDNELYINGEKLEDVATARTNDFSLKELYNVDNIPDNYYFVMGDNRGYSRDSRDYTVGLIKKEDIVGTTTIRIFPFTKIGKFN
ncbi:MAG: signal peptidase I [Firmicutes bacterium]|nr:signal peptidase I [Bacillota bacterium]